MKPFDLQFFMSVRLSVRHKNFNLAHIFWSINDRALIFGMHDPYAFGTMPWPWSWSWPWPTSRSKLLPGGGPHLFQAIWQWIMLSHFVDIRLRFGYQFDVSPFSRSHACSFFIQIVGKGGNSIASILHSLIVVTHHWKFVMTFNLIRPNQAFPRGVFCEV